MAGWMNQNSKIVGHKTKIMSRKILKRSVKLSVCFSLTATFSLTFTYSRLFYPLLRKDQIRTTFIVIFIIILSEGW